MSLSQVFENSKRVGGGHCKKCTVYFVYMEYRLIDSINISFFFLLPSISIRPKSYVRIRLQYYH